MAAVPLADDEPTMELWPRVGRDVLGMSKDATYAAAHSGQIPVLRIGRRLRVPTARLRSMLGLDDAPTAKPTHELADHAAALAGSR